MTWLRAVGRSRAVWLTLLALMVISCSGMAMVPATVVVYNWMWQPVVRITSYTFYIDVGGGLTQSVHFHVDDAVPRWSRRTFTYTLRGHPASVRVELRAGEQHHHVHVEAGATTSFPGGVIGLSELVFEDYFTPATAWSTGACEYTLRRVADDYILGPSFHLISYRGENWNYWSYLPGAPQVQDFVFEITARSASATPDRVEQWSVIFRYRSDPQEYYRLRVFTDGSFDLQCRQDRWHTVQERTYSEHIARERRSNRVRLTVSGRTFIVEINGHEVARVREARIEKPGRVGVGVVTASGAYPYAHAVFTNAVLYRLPDVGL